MQDLRSLRRDTWRFRGIVRQGRSLAVTMRSITKGMVMITKTIAAFFVGALLAGSAQASLIDRGGGLIYDTDLKITWLADANYAATQFAQSGGLQGDADGGMGWSTAINWASDLTYYDSVRNVTYDDWRLPILTPCFGDNTYICPGSELGHLFYDELAGAAGNSILTSSDPDLALFTNIQSRPYWSGTVYEPDHSAGWFFAMNSGSQNAHAKSEFDYAWAVRDGDVAAAAIPEPQTYALFLAGLGLIGFMTIRRKAN